MPMVSVSFPERIKKSLVVGCRSLVVGRIVVLPIFVDTQSIKNAPIKIDLHKNIRSSILLS